MAESSNGPPSFSQREQPVYRILLCKQAYCVGNLGFLIMSSCSPAWRVSSLFCLYNSFEKRQELHYLLLDIFSFFPPPPPFPSTQCPHGILVHPLPSNLLGFAWSKDRRLDHRRISSIFLSIYWVSRIGILHDLVHPDRPCVRVQGGRHDLATTWRGGE